MSNSADSRPVSGQVRYLEVDQNADGQRVVGVAEQAEAEGHPVECRLRRLVVEVIITGVGNRRWFTR